MLIHCDVKSLELVTAAYLSQDPIFCQEIKDGVDFHEANRIRFKLPTRLIAKVFVFRLIYGGSAWSYANDPEFQQVSKKIEFWQSVIDEYYAKYKGMAQWHKDIVATVMRTGKLVMPTGREFHFTPAIIKHEHIWPRTKILNYPVQGTGADLVSIGRVTLWKRLRANGINALLQSTVHDSIDLDVDMDLKGVYNICKIIKSSIEDIPTNFYRLFGKTFNLPITCEISYGPSLGNLTEFKT